MTRGMQGQTWRRGLVGIVAALATLAAVSGGIGAAGARTAHTAATRSPATLGIHDGAINRCDNNGNATTAPSRAKLRSANTSFGSPKWRALNVTTVRYSASWDIAMPTGNNPQALVVNEQCLAQWLIYAHRAHPAITSVEIAFKPDPNFMTAANGKSTAPKVAIPSESAYDAAVGQFINTFTCATATCPNKVAIPGTRGGELGAPMAPVRIIAPWGEPDFGRSLLEMPSGKRNDTFDHPTCKRRTSSNTCGPELAAHMYNFVRAACAHCTNVIAGDFGSGASHRSGQTFAPSQKLGKYLRTYYRYLANPTAVTDWAVHPYGDVEYAQKRYYFDMHPAAPPATGTRVYSFAGALKALNPTHAAAIHIWLDEISSFFGTGQGLNPKPWFTRLSQAYGGRFLFDKLVLDVPPGGPTVTNIYYLNFSGNQSTNAELIKPPNHAYPVYYEFRSANR